MNKSKMNVLTEAQIDLVSISESSQNMSPVQAMKKGIEWALSKKGMTIIETGNCPVCHGTGTISQPSHFDKTHAVNVLFKAGYSYQQIADLLGYKSKRSVGLILSKK